MSANLIASNPFGVPANCWKSEVKNFLSSAFNFLSNTFWGNSKSFTKFLIFSSASDLYICFNSTSVLVAYLELKEVISLFIFSVALFSSAA